MLDNLITVQTQFIPRWLIICLHV